jgi:c-di-GMP-related signal transduction protein
MQATPISLNAIEAIMKGEPALTVKLLRYLNSPLHGLRNEVHSIRHAMTLLGQLDFQRWVSILAVVAMGSDKPAELIRLALTRAYFCEAIAEGAGLGTRKAELFLMGLLSVTDAMLDQPMEHVMKQLPLSDEIRRALTSGPSRFYDPCRVLLAYEKADWGP